MAPLFGRGLAGPVLRPLAERLIDAARLREGDRLILDAPCDGGVLSAALARSIAADVRVVAVDADAEALEAAGAAGPRAQLVRADPAQLPLAAGIVDVALSLLTLAHQRDPAAVVAACASTLRPEGRLIAAVWGERAAVPHLSALSGALHSTLGHTPTDVEDALALGAPGALETLAARVGMTGVRVLRLRDVARFDGVDHLWSVHGTGRLAPHAGELDEDAERAVRHELAGRLRRVTAWDGTLVVPVEIAVLMAKTDS
ncbi:MAG TPA: methyltransferase domain-containing protein [Candidatus Dormibacteraeota bacterium]